MPGGDGSVALSQCNYAAGGNPAAASLMLRAPAQGETLEAAAASVRQTLVDTGIDVQDVSGIGRLAFIGGNQLHVFNEDNRYIIVTPTPAGGLEQGRALAERALARF